MRSSHRMQCSYEDSSVARDGIYFAEKCSTMNMYLTHDGSAKMESIFRISVITLKKRCIG